MFISYLPFPSKIVDFDRKRNTNREALRKLFEMEKQRDNLMKKLWLCSGDIFIRIPSKNAKSIIEHEQENLDTEINRLRKEIKEKTSKLNEIEGLPDSAAPFVHLKPFQLEDLLCTGSKETKLA